MLLVKQVSVSILNYKLIGHFIDDIFALQSFLLQFKRDINNVHIFAVYSDLSLRFLARHFSRCVRFTVIKIAIFNIKSYNALQQDLVEDVFHCKYINLTSLLILKVDFSRNILCTVHKINQK